jgi:ABC-type amino acid transport substrate-binding protein
LASLARRRWVAAGAAGLAGLSGVATAAPQLRAVTLTLPLFGMAESGEGAGIFVDIMQRLGRESGLSISNTMAPKVRAQKMLEAGSADLLIGFDSAELLAGARHVANVANFEVGLIARPGLQLRTLGDLRGKTVGQLRGSRYNDAYAEEAAILKHDTNTMSQILQMLALGRIDAAIGVKEALYYGLKQEGLQRERFSPFLSLDRIPAWLHYSRKTWNDDLARRLAAALGQMQKSGHTAAIIRRYTEAAAGG